MIQFEQRLQQRFPHWFRGRRAAIARPLLRGIARWSRLDEIDAFLAANRHVRGFDFVAAAMRHLGAGYSASDADRARIPAHGRLLIVANHPSGALDALALLDLVGQVRRDVRIVANDFLQALDGLGDLLLPVRILGGRPAPDSLRAIDAALARGECVIVFPAGEVSRLGPLGIRDSRWRRGFLRFARGCDAPVLPVRIQARNSALFYGASALFKPAFSPQRIDAFVDALQCFEIGYSWAGPMSLAVPHDMSRSRSLGLPWTAEEGGTLVRFAIGLEDVEDLRADLARALQTLTD